MQSRRFIADDMRQALKKVRDVLGSEAIILSNRRVAGGIEVIATVDGAAVTKSFETDSSDSEKQPAVEGRDSVFARLLNSHQQDVSLPGAEDDLVATLRSEIENLRLLLKDQMAVQRQEHWDVIHPITAAVTQRLQSLGISPSVTAGAVTAVASHRTIDEGWRASIDWLRRSLVIPPQELLAQGGCFAFVGPTGAGKTTTLAKLAVRFALRHGHDSLALVTTDHQRMGAFEQLRSLGRILGIAVHVADENQSLSSLLRNLRNKKLVLVDTCGLPLDADKCSVELEQLKVCRQLQNLLVLPATSQVSVLYKSIQRLGDLPLHGAVISKVDEADSLGEVLSLVVEKQLPVTYITHGPAIPDDIKLARADALINRLLAAAGKDAIPAAGSWSMNHSWRPASMARTAALPEASTSAVL